MAAQINVSRRPMISSLVLPLFSSLIGRALPTVQRSRFGPILHPGDCCVQPAGLVKVMVLSSCCLVLPCSAVPDPPLLPAEHQGKNVFEGTRRPPPAQSCSHSVSSVPKDTIHSFLSLAGLEEKGVSSFYIHTDIPQGEADTTHIQP